MFYEPASRDRTRLPHDPFKALVAPRPIGWISTKSRAGEINLAPYSFFNALAGSPPLIGFSSEGPSGSSHRNCGYRRLSLTRASSVLNCQSALT
jgi:flavin reductase (DIM6/NTAB) family NADH-FMN oxidoreductase RutF